MTENEALELAIRCVIGACDEGCAYYGADGVCRGYTEVAEGLEKALEEVQAYRAIGTIDELKALKEKSVAKKPTCVSMAKDKDTAVGSIGRCPCCNYIVAEDMLWCDDCGQKLDWQ